MHNSEGTIVILTVTNNSDTALPPLLLLCFISCDYLPSGQGNRTRQRTYVSSPDADAAAPPVELFGSCHLEHARALGRAQAAAAAASC